MGGSVTNRPDLTNHYLPLLLLSCDLPSLLQVTNTANSAYNTPPVWSVYILNLVLQWIKAKGGVEGKILRW